MYHACLSKMRVYNGGKHVQRGLWLSYQYLTSLYFFYQIQKLCKRHIQGSSSKVLREPA